MNTTRDMNENLAQKIMKKKDDKLMLDTVKCYKAFTKDFKNQTMNSSQIISQTSTFDRSN